MEGVTAIETFEIKEEEDGVEEDEESAEEDVEDTTMPEDASAADSRDESTDWDGLFRCLHCEEVFEEKAAFLEHQRLHDEPLLSGDTAAPPDGLLVSTGEGRQTMCCSLCGRIFSDSRGFYSHMMKHRNKLSKKTVAAEPGSRASKQHVYECEDCGKSYAVIGHFLNHQRSHKQASKSVFHDLADLKKKSFQCHTCGRSYSRASALDAHRRCHEVKLVKSRNRGAEKTSPAEGPVLTGGGKHKVKPEPADDTQKLHECPCGKAFRAPSGLRTHQRFSHNDKCSPEKPKTEPKRLQFDCTECDKTYGSRVALVSHQRWHKNRSHIAGKFSCEECGKVFTTLTFYYKHQRLAHSAEETPSKSFLHQVCQLQKKAFECQDCGLRFSRASALQSHQLCHVDVFKEAEKLSAEPTSPLPRHELSSRNKEEAELQVSSQDNIHAPLTETDAYANDTDGDTDDSETGDFNVEVISVSASDDEEETIQDLDPDLELLCESDQEGKEETDFYQSGISPRTLQSKPDMGLKIVQIDFDPSEDRLGEETETRDETSNEKEGKHIQPLTLKTYTCDICGHETKHKATHYNHLRKHEDRKPYKSVLYQLAGLEKNSFKCDECGKCFSRLSALHAHQRHHPKTKPHQCPDCKTSYSHASGLYGHRKSCHARQKPQVDVSDYKKEGFNPKKTLLGPKVYHCEQCGKGFWSLGAYTHHRQNQAQCGDSKGRIASTMSSSRPVYGHPRVQVACPVCGRKFRHRGVMKSHMRKHENGNHKCELCGRSFRLFSSLLRHQVVHNAELLPPPIKSFEHQVEQVKKNMYSCPDCGKRFSRAKALQFHMKSHGYETGYSPSSPRSAQELSELQCSTCHAHFSNKSSLLSHQKLCVKNADDQTPPDDVTPSVSSPKHAAKEKTVKCPKCLSLFTSLLSLQNHRKQCSKRRAADGGLAVKKTRGRKKKSLVANNDQSDVSEKNETDETKSQNTERSAPSSDSPVADLKYKCKECERSFAVVGALNFHKRIHLQGHTSKAKIKLQTPVVRKKLKQTKQTVEPKGQFFCSECGRRFITNAALGTHRRWHTDKKFAGSLVKDEITNSVTHKSLDEGPFHCNKCGKGFFYLCVLRRHQLYYPPCQTNAAQPEADANEGNSQPSHTEFACPQCNKTFVRGSLLAAHYDTDHSKSSEQRTDPQEDGSQAMSGRKVSEEPAAAPAKSEAVPSKKPEVGVKAHQCPHCDLSYTKIRSLRAHKWQAHSRRATKKSEGRLAVTKKNRVTEEDGTETTGANVASATGTQTFAKKKRTGGKRRKRGRPSRPGGPSHPTRYKSIECLDCRKRYSSAGALYNHRKTCSVLKQEIKPVKTAPEEPSPPSRLSESTAKCFFKCDKCGKAFPTEEQLGVHRDLAQSRPYCCALCCRGYWTETQLQQHLAWHDEVRRRLPAELRYRLSATMSSGPAQLNFPLHDKKSPSLKEPPAPNPVPRSQNGHKCQHCGKAFLSPAALQNHEAQHNSDDSYRCSLCPRTFSEIRDLIDHHQECMGEDKRQLDAHAAVRFRYTDGLTCLECGISFGREIELHQHYIEHARGAY